MKIHANITIFVVENREPYYFIIICVKTGPNMLIFLSDVGFKSDYE